MTKPTRVRLERSPTEQTVNAVIGIVSVAVMYYSLHPDIATEHAERVRKFWQNITHRISVNQAINAIRSLPETPEPRNTCNR